MEVRKVTQFWRDQKEDDEDEEEDITGGDETRNELLDALNAVDDGSKEESLYEDAKRVVVDTGRASTTYLQTALGIGYPRAAPSYELIGKEQHRGHGRWEKEGTRFNCSCI
ncbi:MAG: DNA translocase FtsK [Candidatus Moraniibacteriota bacterium]